MIEEEELARKVIGEIRDWLEEEKKSRGEHFGPRGAIRFCGGCNPSIERGMVAEIIQRNLAGIVRWVSWEEEADLLLLINGCLSACADQEEIPKKASTILTVQVNMILKGEGNPSSDDSHAAS